MDGTIANLYAVENWLPMLQAEDTTPYVEAEVMWNMSQLARLMNQTQKLGYKLGIISWTSKGGSASYNEAVKQADSCTYNFVYSILIKKLLTNFKFYDIIYMEVEERKKNFP